MSIKKVMRAWILVFAGITLVICAIVLIQLGKIQTSRQSNIGKLKVTVSFYPLAYLAERIGGDKVIITTLTPSGVEPHDFEPSSGDIARLETQDIILLNGGGLEGYANKIQANINSKNTSLIMLGQSVMSGSDPHVWLDPILYKKEAESVMTLFIKKDLARSTHYKTNYQRLAQELGVLDTEFKQSLLTCAQKNIITSHNAFNYLVGRYGLHQVALTGLSPEQEPSSKTLAEVSQFAKKNKIGYIFFEELVSPAIAETIAKEVGAQTLVLNPIEGLTQQDMNNGKTYLSIQRENLKNLQVALNCK